MNESDLGRKDTSYERMNESEEFELPIDMRFNEGHVVSIVTYSVLMAISALGNSTVLLLILRRRNTSKSRIRMMLMHLAIADLLVTFLMMPLEIGWAITVSWKAGDAACRIMAFFRVFGLYLSSFILICISMDRYYAVIKPLQLLNVDRRGKIMLSIAWMASIFCSMPQMVVFHLETHPNITWYSQCITFNAFPTYTHELTYSLFGMLMMYWFPLIVIIYTYTSILLEICRRSRESVEDRIRRSSLEFLSRAKIRTLKMTIIIVAVFFICWTPYYVMSLWYWIDRTSARNVDQRIQKGLFLFACTNSCMNPIVYGAFNIRDRRKGAKSRCVASLTTNPAKERRTSYERSQDASMPRAPKDRTITAVELQLKAIADGSLRPQIRRSVTTDGTKRIESTNSFLPRAARSVGLLPTRGMFINYKVQQLKVCKSFEISSIETSEKGEDAIGRIEIDDLCGRPTSTLGFGKALPATKLAAVPADLPLLFST